MREGLTYADVLIVPRFSDIESRTDIDIRSNYLGDYRIPIISAPMDTVSGPELVTRMYKSGAYGILHRFGTGTKRRAEVRATNYSGSFFGISIGVKDFKSTLNWLNSIKDYTLVDSVCIDVAHGDHRMVLDTIKWLSDFIDEHELLWKIIAGNVATAAGAERLALAGADAIRVGIGPGSACTTRENTGVGVPQLTAILDCVDGLIYHPNVSLIADGGIQTPGDIAKALAAGADAVMLGKILASTVEAEGHGVYRGQSTVGSNGLRGAPEGIVGTVPITETVGKTIERLSNYLRSSLSYVGARNIKEFRERVEFIKVSPATWRESGTRLGEHHDR